MLERDADGGLKRIEYRGRHLRASRTGGVALRAQTKVAGINLTANTARGARVSTRLAKGTQAAFQNGRFVLRGRYGDGPNKVNISKSGVSVSSKTEIGTVNWFKPRYSSAKIGGIQVRGKNAVYLHLIVGLFQIAAYFLIFFAQALVLLVQGLYWLGMQAWTLSKRGYETFQAKRLESTEGAWTRELEVLGADTIEEAIDQIFFQLGTGQAITREGPAPEALILKMLEGCRLKPPKNLELLFGCLAKAHADKTSENDCIEKFLSLDEASKEQDNRTRLQDRLLGVYAESCGLEADLSA